MSGRVWLITGASRGLGRALVDRVLDVGDSVIATVRGEADLPAHERLVVGTVQSESEVNSSNDLRVRCSLSFSR